jgi:NADH-quinone oxidoreductase subunit J
MLLNAGAEERSQGSHIAMLLGVPSLLLLGVLLTWAVTHHVTNSVNVGSLYGDPKTIGRLLFNQYLLPFEITSLLILIAIMGAVVLASKPAVSASGKEN